MLSNRTIQTPHMILTPAGAQFTSHQGYIEWLKNSADRWQERGEHLAARALHKRAREAEMNARTCRVCRLTAEDSR